jgi:cell division protein FtsZ
VAARVAKSIGALTIAVVTTPFSFEMGRRQKNAALGLAKLRQHTDTLITVSNDRLLDIAPQDLPLEMAFRLADDVLRQGVSGISELLTETGLINVDFAHIRHVMRLGGGTLMAIGTGEGEDKAMKALHAALHHPLLDEVDLESAAGIIANFSGGDDLTFAEVAETMTFLHNAAGDQAEIIPGVINDANLADRAQVILIVTGLGSLPIDQAIPGAEKYFNETPANKMQEAPQQAHQPKETKHGFDFDNTPSEAYSYSGIQSRVNTSDLDIPAFLRKRLKD